MINEHEIHNNADDVEITFPINADTINFCNKVRESELLQKITGIFEEFDANDICDGAFEDAVIEEIKKETNRTRQLEANCKWLIEQIDLIHDALCPEHDGTWQDRARKAVKIAEKTCERKSAKIALGNVLHKINNLREYKHKHNDGFGLVVINEIKKYIEEEITEINRVKAESEDEK